MPAPRSVPIDTPGLDDRASTSVERALRSHPGRALAGLLAAAVFVRLLLVFQVAAGPLPRLHAYSTESDDHFFQAWGERLARGDWLQRKPWHPMPQWMAGVARQAVAMDPGLPGRTGLADERDPVRLDQALWDHWLGGPTYFQEPGYPYLVGLTYRLLGPDPWSVYAWQLLLGVAGVALAWLLGRELHSHAAGLAAGALLVLAPVPLFYEVALLRDALVAYLGLFLALLMAWAVRGGRGRWLWLGLAFGGAVLVKQSFLLFPVLMAGWRLLTVRAPARERAAAAGLAAAGMALALLPLILRNLAVGVPALAMNGSATAMLPVFHAAEAHPFRLVVGPTYVRALVEGGGGLGALRVALSSHPDLWSALSLELRKLAFAWHSYEAPNNVDFYVFRQGAPLLAVLPVRVALLVPLAAAGLLRRPGRSWALLAVAATALAGMVLSATLARYRAALVVALVPLAGAGMVRVAGWISARRLLPAGAWAAASALYLAWALPYPRAADRPARAAEYRSNGLFFAQRDPALGAMYLLESLRLVPGDPRTEARLGVLLVATGEPGRALSRLDAALAVGDDRGLRLARARALLALGRLEEARAEARALGLDGAAPGPAGRAHAPGGSL